MAISLGIVVLFETVKEHRGSRRSHRVTRRFYYLTHGLFITRRVVGLLIPSFSTNSSEIYAIFTRHQNTFTVSEANYAMSLFKILLS